MRSPFRQFLNQHSYLLIAFGIVLLVLLLGLLFDRRVRLALAGASTAAAVLVFAWLRTGDGDLRAASDLELALRAGRPVVLEFYSDYCLACLSAKPAFDRLANEFSGRATFVRVDILSTAGEALAAQHRVDSVPAFLAFDRNGRLLGELQGKPGVPEAALRAMLSRAPE